MLNVVLSRKNGSIVTCDYKFESKAEREFFNALITEVTLPAADASSKEPAYLTVKFKPELTRFKKGSGKAVESGAISKTQQKIWTSSGFRLEISDLDCTRVNKVDSFTVTQNVASEVVGESRNMLHEPGKIDFPNLTISLSEAGAQTWVDWHEDFVIKGNNGESQEKKGSLILLSENLQNELARINFFNLGIFKLTMDQGDANDDAIKRVTAGLYCERMEFKHRASSKS